MYNAIQALKRKVKTWGRQDRRLLNGQRVCQRSAAQPERGIDRRTGDGRGHTLIAAPTAKADHTLQ